MYEVLVTLSQLLAPFTPFIADEIYRNLVAAGDRRDRAPRISVHLSRWPEPQPAYADAQLVADMALAQTSRQPGPRGPRERRPEAAPAAGRGDRRAAQRAATLSRWRGWPTRIKEELNVKAMQDRHRIQRPGGGGRSIRCPSSWAASTAAASRAIRQALLALDPLAVAARRRSRASRSTVAVDGETIAVLPDEIEVRKSPKPGLAVAEEAGYLVAVTTELTDELRWEGWAREVSRNIQELRKKSGLEISDRIRTTVQAAEALAPCGSSSAPTIAADTLSLSLRQGAPLPDAFTASVKIEDAEVILGIRKRSDSGCRRSRLPCDRVLRGTSGHEAAR